MFRRWSVLVPAVVLVALAAACGGGDDDDEASATTVAPTTTSTTAATTTTTTEPPTTTTEAPAAVLAPLTGLPLTEEEAAVVTARPALAVKTDNHPRARPQYGLALADVVYEEPVEGITRYIAIYHSRDPGVVGPIRSVRGIDANTLAPLNPLFAISGGTPPLVQAASRTTQLLDEDDPGFFRDGDRPRPHNLLATAAELWPLADEQHRTPPPPIFVYLDDDEEFLGDDIQSVEISNLGTRSAFEFDRATGTWPRTLDGTPHVTAPDSAQVAPTNVIIQYVDLGSNPEMGGGRAQFLVDGRVLEGTWEKTEPGLPTRFLTASGTDVELRPGQTWVNLVDESNGSVVLTPAAPVQ